MTKKKCKVTIDPEFKAKLVKLRVYKKYMRNTSIASAEYGMTEDEAVGLSYDFVWGDTPEGFDFWVKVEEKLKKL